jgi:glycosyltransferase involved in cell wall biosynthesis
MKKPISVVICTYNGAAQIKACLQSVAEQTALADRFEVIIIDNNSTDATHKIVSEFLKHLPNAKLLTESQVGLSHARNRGFKESTSEYVAYLDDDAKAVPAWIEQAIGIIDEQHPDIFGGPIYPFYETPPPPWLKDEYNSYSVYDGPRYLAHGELLCGSNIFLRRELLSEYGGFDPELGMKANSAGYHEETAVQLRAQSESRRIYYHPGLQVLHLVGCSKQNVLHYLCYAYKSGKDGARIWPGQCTSDDLWSMVKDVDSFFGNMEKAARSGDQGAHSYPENYIIEELLPTLYSFGRAVGYWSQEQQSREFMSKLQRAAGTLTDIQRGALCVAMDS